MNRLYQWLQERATSFRPVASISKPRRMVRTQVTVEEHQRTVLLTMPTVAGLCLCPLCGHPVSPLAAASSPVITMEHPHVHARCPGPEDVIAETDLLLGRPDDLQKLQ